MLDTYGRKPVMIAGGVIGASSKYILAIYPSFATLGLSKLLFWIQINTMINFKTNINMLSF